jgi:hypothetical protein
LPEIDPQLNINENLIRITLSLGQYPILSPAIRARMRRELVTRGFTDAQSFEEEVREQAIISQKHEGLHDPLHEEPVEIWDQRLERVREQYTDLVFSQHFDFRAFEELVQSVMAERGVGDHERVLTINPELSPLELVFEQALAIEQMSESRRSRFDARLQELKVVLIRGLISDQLPYINIAKEFFTVSDLAGIQERKIGRGKIGGKAAGMLLAHRVLEKNAPGDLLNCLRPAESFFVGSDEMYTFMALNNLVHWNDQKYKDEDAMRSEFAQIQKEYARGRFPVDVLEKLDELLRTVGKKPLIVRSSSLLEDNFGTSFAGKYESIFVPNQSTPAKNLKALTQAIALVYASTLNPDALLYRRSKGLQDYDERMGILIQVVQGDRFGQYFFPDAAGVAFSRNLYRWAPQIRREDGFVRLVWGLGTRAVERVGNDYPRLIALSHPLLRPSSDPKSIRRYSQQFVDLIDLEQNQFATLPIHSVLNSNYPPLRYLAQTEEDGYFISLKSRIINGDANRLVLTFDELLRRTTFAERMRTILAVLEKGYRSPVDVEFCLNVTEDPRESTDLLITLLQCRPQSHLADIGHASLPQDVSSERVLFSTHFMVPRGKVENIDYVLFIPPEKYFALTTRDLRVRLARAIGRLNAALERENFICIGPGRWGSSNADLGVPINYGDIYHTRALVELAGQGFGLPPEPSLGTHFFQDLLESQIYPLAIYLDDPSSVFCRDCLDAAPDRSGEFVETPPEVAESLRLLRVDDLQPGQCLQLVMDDNHNQALAYFSPC